MCRERGGSKVSLEFCFKRMQQRGIDTDALWLSIVDVVCKSLYCVQDVIPWHPAAFELFGYDVLIDADLKPWLIEVNSSPSLARDNPLDYEIKDALLRDVLAVVDAPAIDRTALKDVLQVACAVTCANFFNVMLVVLQRRLGDRRRLSNVADAKTAAAAGTAARSPCSPYIQHSSAPARHAAHLARTRAPQVPPPPSPPLPPPLHCTFLLWRRSCALFCRYGELPRELGGFQVIAPSKAWDAVGRVHRGVGGAAK